jgi:GLPGLI family protein
MNSTSFDAGGDKNSKEEETKEEFTVTAWYTPQIPVQNGPGNYYGLPGLILEVNDGSETVLCSKIVLNPSKGVSVKEPDSGKKVNQEKFDAILKKKMDEMNEQFYDGRRGSGGGMEIEIRG